MLNHSFLTTLFWIREQKNAGKTDEQWNCQIVILKGRSKAPLTTRVITSLLLDNNLQSQLKVDICKVRNICRPRIVKDTNASARQTKTQGLKQRNINIARETHLFLQKCKYLQHHRRPIPRSPTQDTWSLFQTFLDMFLMQTTPLIVHYLWQPSVEHFLQLNVPLFGALQRMV